MLGINRSAKFKKDFARCQKRGLNMALLKSVISTLAIPAPLPPVNRDHPLTGNHVGERECHVASDWVLTYRISNGELYLIRTGTHADIFGL